MPDPHRDRVYFVTGGGQGIGRCMVHHFLTLGARVAFLEKSATATADTLEEFAAYPDLLGITGNVAVESTVGSAISATVARFGALHGVVNNAATSAGGPVTELEVNDWNRVLAVNLTGPMLVAKHAAPHLAAAADGDGSGAGESGGRRSGGTGRRSGGIVNIASTRAFMSEANTEAYAATKGGLVALTHSLAVSLGPAVRVNAIAPGWIDTARWRSRDARHEPSHSEADLSQHPVGRVGRPEDIAEAAAWLLSDATGFLTGQCITIDGGMTIKMIYV